MQQEMAPLPAYRVTASHTFASTGVDFCGPFLIKSRGRAHHKRYVCLFVCAATRAVHLEVTDGLDVHSFVNALSRFHARHPGLRQLVSDNGTNFRAGERELREEVEKWRERINDSFAAKGIEWTFSPPSAPHTGGMWERLVKSFKKVFYALLDKNEVGADAFHTLVVVAEGILNSRPITPVSTDPDDYYVLTPNSFLHPGVVATESIQILPPSSELPPRILLQSWRHVRNLVDGFWRRWRREYVTSLQQRRKWTGNRRNVVVGDVVLISENAPRDEWSLARIIETFPDREGNVRRVRLRTKKKKELERHVNSLVLLEAADEQLAPGGSKSAEPTSVSE